MPFLFVSSNLRIFVFGNFGTSKITPKKDINHKFTRINTKITEKKYLPQTYTDRHKERAVAQKNKY